MYTGLKRYFLNKSLKQNVRERKPINFDNAKTAAIILDNDDDIKTVDSFAKYLKSKDVQVKVYFLVYNKSKLEYYSEKTWFHVLFATKSYWLKEKKYPEQSEFVKSDFDVLMDITHKSTYFKDLLLSKSKARFKVGRMVEANKILKQNYDFLISLSKDNNSTENYIEQIKIYLTKINS